MSNLVRIVQITDTHLYADPTQRLLGINTQDSFTAVLQAVTATIKQRDIILLTGDLTQDGSAQSYQRLAQQVATLATPTAWTAGNHDQVSTLIQALKNPIITNEKSILYEKWQLILLNSQIPNAVPGLLAKTELDFLEKCLQKHANLHALICFHHQPIPAGSRWLDNLCLQNAADFFAIIDRYPQVRGVLYGHIHQEFNDQRKQIPYLATPSTCIQFKPKQTNFALDIIAPGYRYLELQEDGKINSKVYRATKFSAFTDADLNAKGY